MDVPPPTWKHARSIGELFLQLPHLISSRWQFEKGRTQGFVARDDNRGEIVVSFRGTFSLKDAITGACSSCFQHHTRPTLTLTFTSSDALAWLTPFNLPGIAKDPKIRVHKGFLLAYKDVSDDVRTIVKNELKIFPTYRIVVTGI
jgi:hypothetical protein